MTFNRRTLLVGMAAAFPLTTMAAMPAHASDKPLYGGTFVAATSEEPASLFSNFTTNYGDQMVAGPIYNRLIELGSDGTYRPDLAERWEISPDGKVYTFHLHSGVKWHDGKPFTSADVKFTFEEILPVHHGQGKAVFAAVQSVETPDDNTVIVTLKEPSEAFLVFVGLRARIVAKHVYEGTDVRQNPANAKPIGTGAFKFSEWQRGSHITLVRNDDYFMKGQPYLDRLIFRIMPDANSRMIALEAGDIDYVGANDLPYSGIARLKRSKDIEVVTAGHEAGSGILQIMFNLERAPFDNVKVRKALSMAIDRQFIVERAGQGLHRASTGPITADTVTYYDKNLKGYAFDPEAAGKLLDEAGFPRGANGTRLSFTLLAPREQDQWFKAAEIVVQQLKEIGIDAKLSAADKAAANELVYVKRDFDALINPISSGPTPALGVARQYLSSNIRPVAFTNAGGYRNPAIDKLFHDADVAPDTETRVKLYHEIQNVLVDEAVTLWVFDVKVHSAFRRDFSNLHNFSAYAPYELGKVWWTKGKEQR
jgi:peptide/nickel transport system substrate-binding protein